METSGKPVQDYATYEEKLELVADRFLDASAVIFVVGEEVEYGEQLNFLRGPRSFWKELPMLREKMLTHQDCLSTKLLDE